MPIYHFSAQVISRSQGRSSVAAAAYRAAEKLIDERTGLTHNFRNKSDVLESEIMLPREAPEWMKDRTELWSRVELNERRKDAQVAREINIALPRELSEEQNWDLAKEFVQREFVDKGMVADVNFHKGHSGNEEQPHIHVMLTMREVSKEGFGKKIREWNDRGLLNDWREHWAEHCNRGLARHGFDLRIDHRTLEAQGINLEPQSKIGPKAAQERMARLKEHQELAQRNGERLLREPEIALKALTCQQSTFTHHDVARLVNRNSVDKEQFEKVYAKIKAQPDLVALGKDGYGRERFTTREMLDLETNMIKEAKAASSSFKHRVSDKHLDLAIAGRTLSSEQITALKEVTCGADLSAVVGFAGTGKSYMLGAAKEAWEKEGYRVQGVTLSGIAAENLEGGSGIKSYTAANRLWHWERDREHLTKNDIVVVDEAGMLGSRQMARILDEATKAHAKVVLVGDPEQLQAIEAGAAFRAITERTGFVELVEIRRQREVWQKQATSDLANQRTKEAILAYERHDNVHIYNTKESAITDMVAQWDEVRSQSPDKSQIMLAYTRDEVKRLNDEARALKREHQELGENHVINTSRGRRSFAEQDRIYFLRNENYNLKVKNGTLGTIEKIEGNEITVRLDKSDDGGQRVVKFNSKDYNDIDHGYAATVYKAQGVTVDRSYVLASKYFDRHSTYVAMSRHREGADLYYSRDEFPTFDDLAKNLGRERTKDVTLDYAKERGFEPNELHDVKDRYTVKEQHYSTNLTKDRLAKAQERLAERQYAKAVQRDIKALEKKSGYSLDLEIKEGDRGIYRGDVEIVGRRYAVMEQEDKTAKLIESGRLESRKKGEEMVVEKQRNFAGKERLKAYQPKIRERERSLDRGMELGM